MGTLKQCLAVTKDFTVEDFDALDSRAKELAGDKKPADSHYIRAAQDIIKTLEQDIQSLEQGIEPEAKVETKAPESEQSEGVKKALEMGRLRLGQNQWSQYAPKGVLWGSLPDTAKAKWADAVEQGKPTMALANDLAAPPQTQKEAKIALLGNPYRIVKDTIGDRATYAVLDSDGDQLAVYSSMALAKDFVQRVEKLQSLMESKPKGTALVTVDNKDLKAGAEKAISPEEMRKRLLELLNRVEAAGERAGFPLEPVDTNAVSTAIADSDFDRARGLLQEISRQIREGTYQGLTAIADDSKTLDGEGLITLINDKALLENRVDKTLTDEQVATLEQAYKAKKGTKKFFTKLRDDVIAYANKGAEAVAENVREIIRAVVAAVVSVGLIFNPNFVSNSEAVVVHTPPAVEQQAEADVEVPAEAAPFMSEAAQIAYKSLIKSLKADLQKQDKLLIIADKPTARMFVFNPDGSLLLHKKTLLGAATGDYLKGSNKLPENRITPAGLFNLGLRDAARGGSEAKTAGEYDFGKVFVLDKAIEGEYSVTIMHSVWLKEKDAAQRKAALQSESANDARYSFGCINVDRATYENLLKNHESQMDGAKLFVVPDNQAAVKEFLAGTVKDDGLTRERIKFRTETGAQPPSKSISIQELNRIVEQVNKALGGDSGITILESVTDIDSTQKPGTRAGGTLKGVAYLFRDGIPDGVEGLKTVFHELFHKGLRNLLPKAEYTAFMNRMYDQSAEVRALADAYLKTDYGKKDTAKMSQQDARALAVEEALAEMAETFTASDFKPSLVRKLGNIFADIADRLGLTKLAQYLRSAPIDPLRQFVMDTVKASVGPYTATYGTQYRPGTTKFKQWFGKSVVVDKDGNPKVMYHGTARDIRAFRAKQANAIFVTDSPRFAETFSDTSEDYMVKELFNSVSPEQRSKIITDAADLAMKNGNISKSELAEIKRDFSQIDISFGFVPSGIEQEVRQLLKDRLPTGPNIIPVYVKAENPFDFQNDSHVLKIRRFFEQATNGSLPENGIREGMWSIIENKDVQAAIRAAGFDGFYVREGGRKNLAVYAPTQIKSAFNSGEYDPTNPDISFRTAREAVNDMADKLSVDGLGKAKEFVLASSFLRDLGSRFGDKLKGVNEFVKTTFDMSARAADLQEAATKVQEAFTGLPAQERKQLMEFMADVTAADVVVEPNENRNNDHLSTTVDGKKVDSPKVKELQDRFAKMSAKQKAAYRVARDGLADNWKRRGDLLARTADEVYNPLIKAAREAGNDSQVRQLERQRRAFLDDTNKRLSQISGDYFPMLRFGEWVVVRKSDKFTKLQDEVDTAYKALEALYAKYDKHTAEQLKAIREANKKLKAAGQEVIGEYTEEEAAQIKSARKIYNDLQSKLDGMKSSEADYYVAQFESESEARRHAKEIKGTVALKRENQRELNPISRTMLTRLEESLAAGLRARGDTSALREAKKAMYEVFLQTLPERSAILRQAKRKNVAGFDRDMERAIITTMLRDSFYLSRMEFGDKISEALNTAYSDAQDKENVDLQRVHNELARRLAASLRYVDTPIQDALAGFTYIYKLGISPGYLFANMTQPFTVSLPMMWARHGAKSNAAFAKAWSQTSKMVAASLKASLGRGEINFENAGLPADEVAMLNEMLRNRLLNVTMVADLARTADGLPTSKFASLMAKPSHFVEVLNRISTALAAYRLEKSKSGVDGATAYAKRVLADTHFDYSVENAPYWMKPGTVPMNKILFQFKKYQLGMISLFVKAAVAMASGDKIAKKEAKAQIFGVMMTHLAVGGVLGMPGFGLALTLANIVAKAFGDDDEPWDSEVALRNYLADTFGKEAGAALSKGLPMLVNADMSKKVGLGDLLNPVPTLRDDKKGRDFVLELLAAAAGPFAGGILPQFGEAASFFAKGDFIKGTEQLLPKWISDPIRAGRFAEEGVTTKQGTVALDREAISAWDVALQAAGVPAARITESYEARAAIEGKKSKMAATASEYKKDWLEARRDGDNDRAEEIWQEIKTKTNPVRVRNGLEPITKSELFRFERERAKTEKKYATVGGNTNQKMGEVGRFALQ